MKKYLYILSNSDGPLYLISLLSGQQLNIFSKLQAWVFKISKLSEEILLNVGENDMLFG